MVAWTSTLFSPLKEIDERLSLSHDVGVLWRARNMLKEVDAAIAANKCTYPSVFMNAVAKYPTKEALVIDGISYTFSELNRDSNRVANFFIKLGVKPHDIVPIFFENCAEFILSFLGLLKAGATAACINSSLTGRSLAHCVNVAQGNMFVFASDLAPAVKAVVSEIVGNPQLVAMGSFSTSLDWAIRFSDVEMAQASPKDVNPEVYNGVGPDALSCLIYTSGTTGFPKGAVYTHKRIVGSSKAIFQLFRLSLDDRFYTAQPLYHSAALVICFSTCMLNGMTCIVSKKFSATQCFRDCKRYNATVMQYIGEICRYLLNTPVDPSNDRNHNVRLVVGNGLRPDTFKDRFGIAQIGEFYAATEGVGALFNISTDASTLGAVGRMGPILRALTRTRIVKFDVVKEEPVRDASGRCIECEVGEPGEMINELDPARNREFAGYYRNEEGTNKKILRNVFKEGDQWYRTGDLLKYDSYGRIYFVDRIGDTFRWKGENVSTNEVAESINTYPGVEEANVYGVAVPGKDGKAGMAAIVTNEEFKLQGLGEHIASRLPKYAVPLFIRILPAMQVTQTFKHQKVALRNDGMDPGKVSDPMFMFDESSKSYIPFGFAEYKSIVDIKAKL
ncbi:hypothetical protein SeLEV6574_g01335 [Synchytrium endobioticum]|uniref:Very long-chain fatty acid transport protein n=1 Tax=Synchytrium endobioticum TaxID=286115 RepID=A0A507DDK6_9FUNG|nr:hypothetical protein SeLEV6574_g01335 [Synchytrium endobioticum]